MIYGLTLDSLMQSPSLRTAITYNELKIQAQQPEMDLKSLRVTSMKVPHLLSPQPERMLNPARAPNEKEQQYQ